MVAAVAVGRDAAAQGFRGRALVGPGRRMARTYLLPVSGVRLGHSVDRRGATGVSVLVFDRPAPTVISARGGASCTYDTASLSLDATFGRRWAVFFSGGSVYGLDAGRGIRQVLLDRGAGHTAFSNPNPVVPISGATLFDLPVERRPLSDYSKLGRRAAAAASRRIREERRAGAGAGARVGKYLGRGRSMPGGIGLASSRIGPRSGMLCLAALNSIGAVRDARSGVWLAGATDGDGRVVAPPEAPDGSDPRRWGDERGTSLVSVVTDVPADRRTLTRILHGAEAGLARSIWPVFTALDGDVVFATSTRESRAVPRERYPGARADRLAALAGRLVGEACRLAVSDAPIRPRRGGSASRGGPG